MATKIYPRLEGPSEDDYRLAECELFGHLPDGVVFTDAQRREIWQRARELFMARQTVN